MTPPDLLQHEIPQTEKSRQTVLSSRDEVAAVVQGTDPKERLLVIIGPCSIHDPTAALQYCDMLLQEKEKHKDELLIVMRSYLEKPRTTVGWKGLVNDPDIDNSFQINKGLRVSRKLFVDLTSKGMPIASEMLDTISPEFLAFLKYEFSRVPAPAVVANLGKSVCRHETLPKPENVHISAELYLCDVDLGCNDIEPVPIWDMGGDTLGFAPDPPEQVVFYACPDSIPDPKRRAELEKQLVPSDDASR